MGSILQPTSNPKPLSGRDQSGHETADRLGGPLIFSIGGLFTHGLALAMQGEASLAPLRLYLIMAAAPIAALVALRFAGKARQHSL